MKVISWNVNSVNSRLARLVELLKRHSPDVVCLQELKCLNEKFPTDTIRGCGYESAVFGQKTYNGVAILTKSAAEVVARGFNDGVDDPMSRMLHAKVGSTHVLSVYVPNGQSVGAPAYQYKLAWLGRLRKYLEKHFNEEDRVIIAGDFNVAPEAKDVHDPKTWEGQILFSDPEREAFHEVVRWGLSDTFRLMHPGEVAFSWWDYRNLSFPFNKGLRIDFIFASSPLAKLCRGASIDREERKGEKPSDHAPVIAEFS